MAISKIILNGTTQMDLTQDSVNSTNTLYGETGHKNDGTSFTGSIAAKTSADLTVSGATVTAPAGYYGSAASKSVASGTEGTPTATKGTVSNHAISVTPSVTNTAGYISGGTKTGTAVSVSASELVSGTYTVDSSGTKDITNYASASVPSGTVGTPSATKGTVSNHAVTVTPSVTNQTGWITGSTKTGTGVSVSASELVSGTYSVTSSGNKDVTNYATASVPAGTEGTPTATKGTVSNHQVSVTPSVTNSAGYISGGSHSGTAVTVTASELASGNKEITANGTNIDVVGYSTVSVDVQGGGGSDVDEDGGSAYLESQSSTLVFDVLGEPTSFVILYDDDDMAIPSGTPYKALMLVYDGTTVHAQTLTNTSNAQVTYDGSSFSKSYSNGTLTITSTGAQFPDGSWTMSYTYGGTAGNIQTSDVQVGSGATSITFTNLEDEPLCWYLIFKSNFSTSNGYQRVIGVRYSETAENTMGFAMDSAAHQSITDWTSSYNNGSLTITSQGTNAGGYFHQPGYYQLTYAVSGDQSMQTKTVTPTTSTQNVTADTGYTGLKKVVVNAIPSSYVQPTTTVGATTYRASTSNQTINAGTYHSAAATIAAVSQTNLTAANIKSGTTITISNGQSNLWSVTGTYTGGGGTSKNVQINQSTTRTTSSTLSKANGDLTVSKTGTYDVYWTATRSATSTQYTWGSQLYVGGSAYGSVNTSWNNHVQNNHLSNVSLTADQKIAVYTQGRSGSYYVYAPMLVIIEA